MRGAQEDSEMAQRGWLCWRRHLLSLLAAGGRVMNDSEEDHPRGVQCA